jgi:hypothetical protein
MPPARRPPMPRLPPFALANTRPAASAQRQGMMLLVFLALFTLIFVAFHLPLLKLPYFWDEHGQFIPTALDLLRDGAWVAHSTLPNIHPPGVEAYLVLWYGVFGYSILVTRVAMLLLAGVGLLGTFLLAIELSRNAEGAPAFVPPLLLMVSPLFFMQGMMAQLDMPAMVGTVLALMFFVKGRHAWAAAACVALVLAKETGLVVPAVLMGISVWRREWKHALLYLAAPVALAGWLLVLHSSTGHWAGNADFARYNVSYSLHPVRIALSGLRRLYYLFIAEFRWIGTLALLCAVPKLRRLITPGWTPVAWVFAANLLIMTLFGGAALERYLLPVLPLFYIAVSVALTTYPRWIGGLLTFGLGIGLITSLFWNPPYPFPLENNLAMVDFVRLQEVAADYVEDNLPASKIATAWPYTAGLARPEYGFVHRGGLHVVETNDFHLASIAAIPPEQFDVLIVYTRTWAPEDGVVRSQLVRRFLGKFYEYAPEVTQEDCAKLGLTPLVSWSRRGQTITIYKRTGMPGV